MALVDLPYSSSSPPRTWAPDWDDVTLKTLAVVQVPNGMKEVRRLDDLIPLLADRLQWMIERAPNPKEALSEVTAKLRELRLDGWNDRQEIRVDNAGLRLVTGNGALIAALERFDPIRTGLPATGRRSPSELALLRETTLDEWLTALETIAA